MVRTRIAPSPTGLLHVGNARTALFNWLFARKQGGKFIVRVEDTDAERSEPEFEQDALINFQWLGLEWDEGPILESRSMNHESRAERQRPRIAKNHDSKFMIHDSSDEIGDYGPYRQSRRGEIYKKYLEELYEEGHLYHCFCTQEELEAMRQDQLARGQPPRYIGRCRELSKKEVKERLSRGVAGTQRVPADERVKATEEASVLRFVMPAKKMVVRDLIRGNVEFDTGLMGDTVVARDFTRPLFHFAVVVDDFTMEISHVIRGEDHLSNTPLHMLIQEALGFPTPAYAHIPLILGPDRAKLSKRHGATAVTEYRAAGYLPEAMFNFLALLGWHPEGEKELLSREELIEQFSLERVQQSAAIFNVEKLRWLNGEYLKMYSGAEATKQVIAFDPELGSFGEMYLEGAINTVRARAKTLGEIRDSVKELYLQEPAYPKELLRWKDMDDEQITQSLDYVRQLLEPIEDVRFIKEELESALLPKAAEWGRGDRGKLLWPLRVALSGKDASPGPFEIAGVLGKEKTLERIKRAIELIVQKEK